MTPVWQWSVRRARWAGLLATMVCAGGVGGLLYGSVAAGRSVGALAFISVAPVVLALAWGAYRLRSERAFLGTLARGTLAFLPDGTWRVILPTGTQRVQLVHAWPCFGWVAIRCQPVPRVERQTPYDLMLYRVGMPPDAWSELRRQVAAHANMRAPRLKDIS